MRRKERGREKEKERERAILLHQPIQQMNYGPASFSRKDYKLILSPQDNYSKVQLLTQRYVWPRSAGSDTHPFYTFIFSLQHSKSAWWQWFISWCPFLSSSAILFHVQRSAQGPQSPQSPLQLNVSFSFYTVFSDQFVSPLFVFNEWGRGLGFWIYSTRCMTRWLLDEGAQELHFKSSGCSVTAALCWTTLWS